MRSPLFTFCLVATVILAGCGTSGPETVYVEGTLTIGGRPPGRAGTIFFTPAEAASGLPLQPGKAEFKGDGHYVAKSMNNGGGLVPGRYRVGIHCWETPPSINGPPPKSLIAEKYQHASTSEIELDVPAGQRRATFDIPIE